MWDIVWVLPQGHRSVSVSRHFLLQAPQCPCSVQKWFSRDHCCRARTKPGCRTVESHTRFTEYQLYAEMQNHHVWVVWQSCTASRQLPQNCQKATTKTGRFHHSNFNNVQIWILTLSHPNDNQSQFHTLFTTLIASTGGLVERTDHDGRPDKV